MDTGCMIMGKSDPMVRHILFDLDGTLAPIDMDVFLPQYLKALGARFRDRFAVDDFQRKLLDSTMVMINNLDPDRTNEQVFWDHFPRSLGASRETLEPIFLDFYALEYRDLRNDLSPAGPAAEALTEALNQGCTLTIATNPIFPLRAVQERLAWIGCDGFPFQLITSIEGMHFCKPHREYYREVLSILGARAEECLMIGNDVEEDMVASRVGMKTCLVTDRVIQRGQLHEEPDYRCTLAELPEMIRKLKRKEANR